MADAQFPDEQDESGEFQRQGDAFERWIKADGSSDFPAQAGRYHLYVCLACPWAHRIIILRKIKKLEDAIGMTLVDPIREDEPGWRFADWNSETPQPGDISQGEIDPINGFKYLKEAYQATDPNYRSRVTVPVLWDKQEGVIVSNNDDDLMRMLNREFDAFGDSSIDLVPTKLEPEIDRLNDIIYHAVNNGVYKTGFATTQSAYEESVYPLFDCLDMLESRLARTKHLFGDLITETDWRLFVTLIRFDCVYHGHFKCNLRRIIDYPNLSRHLINLYNQPGIAETVNFDHIKRHYYVTHDDINPTQIVPAGPVQNFVSAE